jgi:hypothetical protein
MPPMNGQKSLQHLIHYVKRVVDELLHASSSNQLCRGRQAAAMIFFPSAFSSRKKWGYSPPTPYF